MKKGERIANRTRSSIKRALLDLIHEKNYPDIRVNEITQRADVGRSTLYKHYQSKADVLVDIHKDMFERLFCRSSFSEVWLNQGPPVEWTSFLAKHQRLGRNPFLLTYKLGNDLDYLMNNITGLLSKIIEARLCDSYADKNCTIPIPILSQAVSASFSGLIMSWFTRFQSMKVEKFVGYLHQTLSALIKDGTP